MNHSDAYFIPHTNRLEEEDFEDISGMDAALDALHVNDGKPEGKVNMKVSVLISTQSMWVDLKYLLCVCFLGFVQCLLRKNVTSIKGRFTRT